eukprot:CAMPEP_0117676402 /NCGR_PEP_ID=MMETSP0804-20121206/16153_1 /TAXON_ID=1074897 /ORGANISM="Tetraselmis astigmatica, Strain CCMP880" /LENGTH=774 /DNA_ID=CAMNT_0005485537 /DNA_START=172 /DNA_END=2493 /DNA_ORIENTATION=+
MFQQLTSAHFHGESAGGSEAISLISLLSASAQLRDRLDPKVCLSLRSPARVAMAAPGHQRVAGLLVAMCLMLLPACVLGLELSEAPVADTGGDVGDAPAVAEVSPQKGLQEDTVISSKGSCSADSDSPIELAEGCAALPAKGDSPQESSGAALGTEELEKVKAEVAALEERILAGRALVARLVEDVTREEERVLELQRMIGGEALSRLHPGTGALARDSTPPVQGRGGLDPAGGVQGGGRTFRLKTETWSDLMQPRVAMQTEADITAAKVVCSTPQKGKEFGTCHYVILGDKTGALYFFHPSTGKLGAELDTGTGSPVTALHEYTMRRNVTMLVTGHASGEVLLHTIHEDVPRSGPRTKNAPEPLRSAKHASVAHHLLNSSTWESQVAVMAETNEQGTGDWAVDAAKGLPGVQLLETFKCGRQRCLAVAFSDGSIGSYYDNTTVRNFDSVTMAGEQPLSLRVSVTQVTVVYPSGIAFMPVRRKPNADNRIQLHDCKGLNESSLIAYQWDALVASRGYAVTDLGDLLVVITGSGGPRPDGGRQSAAAGQQCFVRSRVSAALPGGPLVLAHIKGYLFAASPDNIGVFNTTNYYRQGLQEVVVEPLESLSAELQHSLPGPGKPILATDRDRLLLVGLSGGLAAIYHSNLYVISPYDMSDMRAWTQPLFIAAMLIVGVWQFYRAKTNGKGGGRGGRGGQGVDNILKGLPPHLRQEVSREISNAEAVAPGGLQAEEATAEPTYCLPICDSSNLLSMPCTWEPERAGAAQPGGPSASSEG